MMTTNFRDLVAAQDVVRTPKQRTEHARYRAEADLAGSLAELVYNLRDEAGITQTELARRMGTTQSSIARIEAGGNTPTIVLLDKLGRALGTSLTLSVAGHAVTFGSKESVDPPQRRPAAAVGTTRTRVTATRAISRVPVTVSAIPAARRAGKTAVAAGGTRKGKAAAKALTGNRSRTAAAAAKHEPSAAERRR